MNIINDRFSTILLWLLTSLKFLYLMYLFWFPTRQPDTTTNRVEKTEIVYGEENIINIFIRFINKSKNIVNICVDSTRPSLAIVVEGLKKSFLDAKSRGVRLRYLTEITSQNISYCRANFNCWWASSLRWNQRQLLHKRYRISCSCNSSWQSKTSITNYL